MDFVRSLKVADLGTAGGFALWAFRAVATTGVAQCGQVAEGFERALGPEGAEGCATFHALSRLIGFASNRPISLAKPRCCQITADELSILAALAASQVGDEEEQDFYISWLGGGNDATRIRNAMNKAASLFLAANLEIRKPPIQYKSYRDHISGPVHHVMGMA